MFIWSAAACCRFVLPQACLRRAGLAPRWPKQASARKSGSKLPHSI